MAEDGGNGYNGAAAFLQHVREDCTEGGELRQGVDAEGAVEVSEDVNKDSRVYIPFHIFSG